MTNWINLYQREGLFLYFKTRELNDIIKKHHQKQNTKKTKWEVLWSMLHSDINLKPQCSLPFFISSCHLGHMKNWWYLGFTEVTKGRIKCLDLEGNGYHGEICFEPWTERAYLLNFICRGEMKGAISRISLVLRLLLTV